MMSAVRQLIDGFLRWIDCVAVTIVAAAGRFASRQVVQLIERERGTFTLRASGRREKSKLPDEKVEITEGEVFASAPQKIAAMLNGSCAELVLQSDRFLFRPLELPKRAGEFLDGIVRSQIDRLTPWNANEVVFGLAKPEETGADRMVVTVAATARAVVAPFLEALTRLGVKSIEVSTLLPGPEGVAVKILDEKGESALDAQRVRSVLMALLL